MLRQGGVAELKGAFACREGGRGAMATMATRATVMLLLLGDGGTTLTVDGGAGWELSFSPPVLAAGHINTTTPRS